MFWTITISWVILLLVLGFLSNRLYRRKEAAIADYERRTGHQWLREGMIRKGGHNGPPRFERPPPPRSQVAR
jgi:hypothetical protein